MPVVLDELLDIPLPPVTFPLDAMDTPLVSAASNHAMSKSSQYLTTLYDRVFNTPLAGLQDILLWDAENVMQGTVRCSRSVE